MKRQNEGVPVRLLVNRAAKARCRPFGVVRWKLPFGSFNDGFCRLAAVAVPRWRRAALRPLRDRPTRIDAAGPWRSADYFEPQSASHPYPTWRLPNRPSESRHHTDSCGALPLNFRCRPCGAPQRAAAPTDQCGQDCLGSLTYNQALH